IIQSSQPISLKFTWSAFLLHLAFRFLLGLFPFLSSWPDLALISLKNRSLFFVLPNTKKRAFSLTCLPVLFNPILLRSIALPLSKASSSKHKLAEFLKFLKSFQMSNTSHFGVSAMLTVRESRRVAACLFVGQLNNFTWEGFFLNIRSSAPNKPSFSNALMSKTYFCFLMAGARSSKTKQKPHTLLSLLTEVGLKWCLDLMLAPCTEVNFTNRQYNG
uniref:Uncharacterized protein n=1 Tax=Gopherus agassizii TaxID=38772 RepID=A0A452HI47_9SAUR